MSYKMNNNMTLNYNIATNT